MLAQVILHIPHSPTSRFAGQFLLPQGFLRYTRELLRGSRVSYLYKRNRCKKGAKILLCAANTR
jgi:hypothetical protein